MNYKKTVRWYYDKVFDMEVSNLFRYIEPYVKNKKVLDLGCGTGRYLERFSNNSIGIEASLQNIEIIKKKGLKVKFGDLNEKIDFADEEFDVVFCSHILEHVDSPINLLRECNRILKKNGLIIIAVPNEINLPNIIGLDGYFRNHPEHLYSFSLENLKVLLQKADFEIEKIFIDLYLMMKFIKRFPLMGSSVLYIIQRMPKKLVLPFSNQYLVVGKKCNLGLIKNDKHELKNNRSE